MAKVHLKGSEINTIGDLPQVGTKALNFELVANDLSVKKLADFAGKNIVLNIFPSVDTPTCAMSVRTFNERAAGVADTVVLCISKDLPFAQSRFCASEGLDGVVNLSDFQTGNFGKDYGMELIDGVLKSLLSRSVIVIDKTGTIKHVELVAEIANEPNYAAAFAALK